MWSPVHFRRVFLNRLEIALESLNPTGRYFTECRALGTIDLKVLIATLPVSVVAVTLLPVLHHGPVVGEERCLGAIVIPDWGIGKKIILLFEPHGLGFGHGLAVLLLYFGGLARYQRKTYTLTHAFSELDIIKVQGQPTVGTGPRT